MNQFFENKLKVVREKLDRDAQNIDLPTLPSVYNQLRTLLAREDCSFESVAEVIHTDPAITLKVLKLVNSAAFGFNTEIKQIQSAVRLIGFNQLSHLILGLSVLSLTESTKDHEFNYKRFWEHSIAVGAGARILISKAQVPIHLELEDAFVAGLLHDIGKLIEERCFPKEFDQAINMCKQKHINLALAEDALLGFNHQHIGALMMRQWKLPKIFEYVCANHHEPVVGPQPDPLEYYNSAVHLANAIAKAVNLGSGGDPFVPQINYQCWDTLKIPISEVPKICTQIRVQTKELYLSMF